MKTRHLFVFTLFCVVLFPLALSEAASSPALRLVGIGLGPEPGDAIAIIEDLTTRKQFSRTTEQIVDGAIILAIQERQVLLQRGEKVKVWKINHRLGFGEILPVPESEKPTELRLEPKEPEPSKIAPTYRLDISGLDDPVEIQKRLAPPLEAQTNVKHYPVAKTTVRYLQADLEDLLISELLTIEEHEVMGSGLQVDAVAARAFGDLGLQEGDLLLKLNGIPLVSPDSASTVIDVLDRAKIISLIGVRSDDLIALKFAVE